ncbi:DNA polymerase III subunit delta' [Sedimentitalea sp. HM32M-2]|uniref:DNA polymerase III subunit delta' n=1 Tax=Sedimentitalea sp. HM32M-2 TaxID=3351566 RepID=UPI003641FE8B
MSADPLPPDQAPGAPHPRETAQLFGQDAAQNAFLQAYTSGRMHHGWLLTGPRGIGKATLAWRIARFLLATPAAEAAGMFAPPPPDSLDIAPDHPVARRILAGAEPGLAHVTRSEDEKRSGRIRQEIVVDDIRRLARFFGLSAADGGRRVVIVDAADEMNTAAANALLKMLEEPPARTTLLLVAHHPSRLLPTIRSRCRTLRLNPLDSADMQAALSQAGTALPDASGQADHLAALAAGSVGAAFRLLGLDGLRLYGELIAILDSLPALDRPRALALAQAAAQRGAAETFDLLLDLTEIALTRLARTGASGTAPRPEAAPGEAAILTRLAPDPGMARAWAETAAIITDRSRHGQSVNLDPAALVLDTVFKMKETVAGRPRANSP